MQHTFLKQFSRRMKTVGLYSVLVMNSLQKTTWRQYGFLRADEQLNMTYIVMLYIMEQSLKEEHCTMDDIGSYLDGFNTDYLHKPLSYEDCKKLADFIVNTILCNEGKPVYFESFDPDEGQRQQLHISYVANRIVYLDADIRRTSYYLTDDGYSLMLSTLEIENNMKLTIHELIFQMHLEKQSYDKAVDEIKSVFNLLRIQLQKIQEAMGKIRRNALNYTVADYEEILLENMKTVDEARENFCRYREMVKMRVNQLEEENINVHKLDAKKEERLGHLKVIEEYLNRSLDELQKILNSHFDLKALYTKELEMLSQMSLIRRFPLRTELYDKVLTDASFLENLMIFMRPLFQKQPDKIYNLNKALEIQKPIRKGKETEVNELLDFDEEKWREEQEERRREKRKKYESCLNSLLEPLLHCGKTTLEQLKEELVLPDVIVFKEIMIELLKNREMDFEKLRKERSENILESGEEFQLTEFLLEMTDKDPQKEGIQKLRVQRLEDGSTVEFQDIEDENGRKKCIRCSNVLFEIIVK